MSIRIVLTKDDGTEETRDVPLSECVVDGDCLIISDCPRPGETMTLPIFTVEHLVTMRNLLIEEGQVRDFEQNKARLAIQRALNRLAGKFN